MSIIHILDQNTVDKIAAGEVVERPASIVKELTENAIDAGASRITIEIKDGGISMIRITDDGKGIAEDDVRLAFLRHATSKLRTVDELKTIGSLGFRGEALSSIAAVSRVELITKQEDAAAATRYVIEGGKEKLLEEVGAPDGTTIVVRDIFYNTPARAKFLKTAQTEAAHVGSYVEQLALSRPDIGFEFIQNGTSRLSTTGSGNLKDTLYHIYGRSVVDELLPVDYFEGPVHMTGFIAKPSVSRGNRNFENYFVNGRYVRSRVIALGIESGYGNKLMQHQYPFTCLTIRIDGDKVDVNVHPTKMDVRFSDEKGVLTAVMHGVSRVLQYQEMIVKTSLNPPLKPSRPEKRERYANPEPFERREIRERSFAGRQEGVPAGIVRELPSENAPAQPPTGPAAGFAPAEKLPENAAPAPRTDEGRFAGERLSAPHPEAGAQADAAAAGQADAVMAGHADTAAEGQAGLPVTEQTAADPSQPVPSQPIASQPDSEQPVPEQQPVRFEQGSFMPEFLAPEAAPLRRIIGCAFNTYWIVEYGDSLYLIDQHAAHEKVLYCRFMRDYENSAIASQQVSPPVIVTLSAEERVLIAEYGEAFERCGFEIESFGGNEYKISAVPYSLSTLGSRELFTDLLDHLEVTQDAKKLESYVLKVATEACKAAVKGGDRLSFSEAKALIDELFTCDDPYHCPHGRPTIITLTERDLEKRFRRIV